MARTDYEGSIRWAVVPFAPKPPFRVYAGKEREPYEVSDVERLVQAAKNRGDAELTYLVPAKARPILILSEPDRSEYADVTGLRLMRLSKSPDPDRIRSQRDPLMFHLDPDRFDLPEESAVMVNGLVTVNAQAISQQPASGILTKSELRVLGERIIKFYRFDTQLLVQQHLQDLAKRTQR